MSISTYLYIWLFPFDVFNGISITIHRVWNFGSYWFVLPNFCQKGWSSVFPSAEKNAWFIIPMLPLIILFNIYKFVYRIWVSVRFAFTYIFDHQWTWFYIFISNLISSLNYLCVFDHSRKLKCPYFSYWYTAETLWRVLKTL